jgi:hypothetical protein
MNRELLAQYGEACIQFEIAQNQLNVIKQKVVEEMNKDAKEQQSKKLVLDTKEDKE